MPGQRGKRAVLLPWACLSIVCTAFAAPVLLRTGTNIVTETYRLATLNFLSGKTPFGLMPGADFFQYSPFFCLLYSPIAWLPLKTQALVWALANSAVFWWGLVLWLPPLKKLALPVWLALILVSMELNISLLYQQVNALLVGLILIGAALYRDGKFTASGIVLALSTDLKVIPVLFAALLLFPFRKRYVQGLVLGFLIAFFLPFFVVGPQLGFQLQKEWVAMTSHAWKMVRPLQLDIVSTASRLNPSFRAFGQLLWWALLLVSLPLLLLERKRPFPRWGVWLTVGFCLILLLSPRSESPTFIILAPAYPLMMLALGYKNRSRKSRLVMGGVWLSAISITLIFTDVWPRDLPNPLRINYLGKTLGTLLLWVLSVACLWNQKDGSDSARS